MDISRVVELRMERQQLAQLVVMEETPSLDIHLLPVGLPGPHSTHDAQIDLYPSAADGDRVNVLPSATASYDRLVHARPLPDDHALVHYNVHASMRSSAWLRRGQRERLLWQVSRPSDE